MTLIKKNRSIYLILIVFFLINLFFLTEFPFVHSDEAWLSGLSRTMLEKKDLSVTEPFFDLYPRNPHAIKTFFHLIQIIFIKILGYDIFTFRLISLLTGTIALYFFYQLSLIIFQSSKKSLLTTLLLAVDIQFIYATHLARQEIILIFFLIFGLYLFLKNEQRQIYQDISLGMVLGISIGIHPNSFIITLPLILIYLYHLVSTKKLKARNFLAFSLTLFCIAAIFVGVSFIFDSNFIANYTQYGEKLGVLNSLLVKIGRLDYFYLKLFYGVSGTYYTPTIQIQLLLFAAIVLFSIYKIFLDKKRPETKTSQILLLAILAINLGYVLIGRYNQTSIIFIFPLCYLLTSYLIKKNGLLIGLIIILALNSGFNLLSDSHYNYDDYLQEISEVVNPESPVLANLNSEYYFANGKLFDYRNLSHLKDHNLTFSDYIRKHQIEYIIYPEEMDFIYQSRPQWNALYGNVADYYLEMISFFKDNCTLIHQFTNESYGIRIARYIGKKDWSIKIYRVIATDLSFGSIQQTDDLRDCVGAPLD